MSDENTARSAPVAAIKAEALAFRRSLAAANDTLLAHHTRGNGNPRKNCSQRVSLGGSQTSPKQSLEISLTLVEMQSCTQKALPLHLSFLQPKTSPRTRDSDYAPLLFFAAFAAFLGALRGSNSRLADSSHRLSATPQPAAASENAIRTCKSSFRHDKVRRHCYCESGMKSPLKTRNL